MKLHCRQDRRDPSLHGEARRISGEDLAAAITEGRAGLPAFLSGSSEGREDGVGGWRLGFVDDRSPVFEGN